jgi:hypothetical protein
LDKLPRPGDTAISSVLHEKLALLQRSGAFFIRVPGKSVAKGVARKAQ